mgnify:CR=1 FL=1
METSTNYSKTAGVRRADKSENTTLFRNVYLWMTMALFITGATALTVSDSPTLLNAIFGSKVAFFGLIIAELALVIILSSFIFRMSFLTATLMFIAYSILNGATLASIFLLYTASSIASTGTPAGSSLPLKTTPPIWGSAPSSATTRWRGRTSVWWWAT